MSKYELELAREIRKAVHEFVLKTPQKELVVSEITQDGKLIINVDGLRITMENIGAVR